MGRPRSRVSPASSVRRIAGVSRSSTGRGSTPRLRCFVATAGGGPPPPPAAPPPPPPPPPRPARAPPGRTPPPARGPPRAPPPPRRGRGGGSRYAADSF